MMKNLDGGSGNLNIKDFKKLIDLAKRKQESEKK